MMTGEVAGKKTPKDDEREDGRSQQAGCIFKVLFGGQILPNLANGLAQRQRRDWRDAITIIAYSGKSRLRGAAEPLSAGAGVGPLYIIDETQFTTDKIVIANNHIPDRINKNEQKE